MPDRDPNPLCKVAGGTFGFGAPPTQVEVESFLIDQFEVSTAQAALFLNARGSNECPGLDVPLSSTSVSACIKGVGLTGTGITEVDGTFLAAPGFERTSTLAFTWEGAMQYCAWVGKQVPSSAQWEYAARHDPRTGRDRRFPWGDDWQPYASCWHFEGCAAPPAPAEGASWIGLFDGSDGRGDGSSPWGVHDLVGGASELVFRCADPDATCHAGEECPCEPQTVYGDGPTLVALQPTTRLVLPGRLGGQGLRCVHVPAGRPQSSATAPPLSSTTGAP